MKVLAINSSPNMKNGNTALILTPFLDGMKEEGAEIELFYTNKLKINPCQGEFNCWFQTPGKCIHKDDMQIILPILANADVIVLATPLYVDGFSGPMKNLLDRVLPLGSPLMEIRDNHSRHPTPEGTILKKIVLISTCGFWELDNFDSLVFHTKSICKNFDAEFAGALLRPHGAGLKIMLEMGLKMDDIFEAAKEAGHQLMKNEKISQETLNIVSRELIPRDLYIKSVNEGIKQQLIKV